jgi:hypothetical protein
MLGQLSGRLQAVLKFLRGEAKVTEKNSDKPPAYLEVAKANSLSAPVRIKVVMA